MTVFDELGVRRIINAKGPATRLSGGIMRPDVVAACTPWVFDAVIVGQDKSFIGALVWPSPAAMLGGSGAASGISLEPLMSATARALVSR